MLLQLLIWAFVGGGRALIRFYRCGRALRLRYDLIELAAVMHCSVTDVICGWYRVLLLFICSRPAIPYLLLLLVLYSGCGDL